ncbi:MAG TPA: hypothetical protein VGU20_20025 [Stellaceae bacterium]|nr:hypothetical protein [Stellaceae bacterium]
MTTAILDLRPATQLGTIHASGATIDFVRLFALDDRLSDGRRPLVCHWQRDAEGRLACIWEPDIPPVPHR